MVMQKAKIIGVIVIALLFIIPGSYFIWKASVGSSQSTSGSRVLSSSSNDQNAPSSLNVSSGDGGIPLSGMSSDSGSPLSAGSASQGQASGSTGTQNKNSGNGGSATLDPKTFAQYDQYITGTSALFGEIKEGTGAVAEKGKTVTVYYRGWLTNGTLFDENVTKQKPFSFVVGSGAVIPGWEQDIVGMKVGGERLMIVPPSVGYGEQGQGPIPGNAVLIFDVTLIDVK